LSSIQMGMEKLLSFVIGWFNIDWGTFRWSDLWTIEEFHWTLEKTPFSHVQIPILIGIGYVISLYSLQNYMRDKKTIYIENGFCVT